MPPGHFNAIFLKDASRLKTEKWQDAFMAAAGQDAFIFWNHPGWEGQQPDNLSRWYDEHNWLLEQGWMHGIEVVNAVEYYPEAHQWCIDNNLTMLSNSDTHGPVLMEYPMGIDSRRPMTIVFAEEKIEKDVHEALKERRAVVYSKNRLIGDEKYVRPLFENSVEFVTKEIEIKGRERKNCFVKNNSDIEYKLVRISSSGDLRAPREIIIEPGKTVIFSVGGLDMERRGSEKIKLEYFVENLLVKPNEAMKYDIELYVHFMPSN